MATAGKFHEEIVLDLGVGKNIDGYVLALVSGARGYIAVEHRHMQRFFAKITAPDKFTSDTQLREKIAKNSPYLQKIPTYDPQEVERVQEQMRAYLAGTLKDIPVVLLAEDMLVATKRLPDQSVSVLAGGIDSVMISDDTYAAAMEEEIARILSPSGAYAATHSRLQPKGKHITQTYSDQAFELFTARTRKHLNNP